MAFLAWMLGSKIGRWAFGVLLGVAFVGMVLLRVYSEGRTRERARQREEALRRLLERAKKDDEITRLGPDDRLRRLERWVRPDD